MLPPNAKKEVTGPAPANPCLAVFKSFTSVQAVPFQVSVLAYADGFAPPAIIADVLLAPSPAK